MDNYLVIILLVSILGALYYFIFNKQNESKHTYKYKNKYVDTQIIDDENDNIQSEDNISLISGFSNTSKRLTYGNISNFSDNNSGDSNTDKSFFSNGSNLSNTGEENIINKNTENSDTFNSDLSMGSLYSNSSLSIMN